MWLDWVFPNCLYCSVPSGERKGTISSKSIPTSKVSLKHNIQTVFSIPSSQGCGIILLLARVWQFLNMKFGHSPETEILKGALKISWKTHWICKLKLTYFLFGFCAFVASQKIILENTVILFRWRIEERSFLSENAINDAEDESRPLLAHDPLAYNERPMSPTGQPMGGEGRQPVVGYISNSNARQNYGSTVPVSVGTTSVMRSLESPALYNAQVFLSCGVFR